MSKQSKVYCGALLPMTGERLLGPQLIEISSDQIASITPVGEDAKAGDVLDLSDRILAWEDVEAGAFRDPEFVKPFESAAQAVAVEEGGRAKVTLKAIPFEKVAGEGR